MGYRGAIDGAICPGAVRPGGVFLGGVFFGEGDVRPGRVGGQGHRADQRRVCGEAGGYQFGRERGARLERLLQARPQPLPGLDQAAAHRDPGRVHEDGQVDHVKGQLGDELADEAIQPGLGGGRAEDVGGRHRRRSPAGQGLAADHVFQRDPGPEREAHVWNGPEVVADLAGGAVRARDDPAADDQGRGQPRAQVQVDGRVAVRQRTPAHLGLGRCLGVGGHPRSPRPGRRRAAPGRAGGRPSRGWREPGPPGPRTGSRRSRPRRRPGWRPGPRCPAGPGRPARPGRSWPGRRVRRRCPPWPSRAWSRPDCRPRRRSWCRRSRARE